MNFYDWVKAIRTNISKKKNYIVCKTLRTNLYKKINYNWSYNNNAIKKNERHKECGSNCEKNRDGVKV